MSKTGGLLRPARAIETGLSQVVYAFGLASQIALVRWTGAEIAATFVVVLSIGTVLSVATISRLPDAVATRPPGTSSDVWRALSFVSLASPFVIVGGSLGAWSVFGVAPLVMAAALGARLIDGVSAIAAGEMLRQGHGRAHAASWATRGLAPTLSCGALAFGGGLLELFVLQLLLVSLVAALSLRYLPSVVPLAGSVTAPLVAAGLSLGAAQISIAMIPSVPRLAVFGEVADAAFANFGVLSYVALALVPINQGLGQIVASRFAVRSEATTSRSELGAVGRVVFVLGVCSVVISMLGWLAIRTVAGEIEGITTIVVFLSSLGTALMLWSMPLSVVLIANGRERAYAVLCAVALLGALVVIFSMRTITGAALSLLVANSIRFVASWRLSGRPGKV